VDALLESAYRLDPAALFADVVGEPDPWQLRALRSDSKRALYLCSRQSGKSSVASIKALWTAMYQPGSLVLMVSKSLPQSQELFRKSLLAYRKLGRPMGVEYESRLHLELSNASRLISLPGSESTTVGYSAHMVLIDEAAETSSDLIDALLPSVAATRGTVIALTSAKAATGWFFQLWSRPDVGKVWETHRATADDSSLVTDEIIEDALATRGPRHVRREYYCEWGQDETSWIEPEKVDRAFTLVDTSEPLWRPQRRMRLAKG
jgi:hypothetical protein